MQSVGSCLSALLLCFHSLLRTAILRESVMRGDSDNVAKVKEMFSDWSKLNTRFVGLSLLYSTKDSYVTVVKLLKLGGSGHIVWNII